MTAEKERKPVTVTREAARPAENELIIHGHFYQPPREDPWIEEIDEEPSAAPYANWNERIHSECYRPNAFSRVLGEYARTRVIVNNYAHLSFNFGPTLLSWMERYDPETIARLVNADQESAARNNGHGNAIAQGYNHSIMPLADERDRETQILWGLEDFRHRFGREAESMWMPETAVDLPTLSQLVAHGMKFIILSPYQAEEVQAPDRTWKKVEGGRMDTSRAYWIQTPAGRIAAFFYHPDLSSDISFSHLLRNSDTFVDRLQQAFAGQTMVNIATDGEIYGHHEPFGDMCLAYTFNEHLSGRSGRVPKRIRVTNYGSFLERHPPELEARIRPNGSSWSCAHGVERWRSDCGCRANHGNGWNQKWRAPLRQALDGLRDGLRKVFESEGAKLLSDPWAARNAYVRVVLSDFHRDRKASFAAEWFRGNDPVRAWRLLESQRNALLMYTSCGWFFDDISGIEPKQLMLYAARAVAALGPMAPAGAAEKFVKKLKEASSNDPAQGDGAKIFKAITTPRLKAKMRILNQAILASFAGIEPHRRSRYQVKFEGEAFWKPGEAGVEGAAAGPELYRGDGAYLGRGSALVVDIRNESVTRYAWVGRFRPVPPETVLFEVGSSFRWPGGDPRDRSWEKIRPVAAERKGALVMGVRDLFVAEARKLLAVARAQSEKDLDVLLRGAVAALDPAVELANVLSLPPGESVTRLFSLLADHVWSAHMRAGRFAEARRLEQRLETLGVEMTSRKGIGEEFSRRLDELSRPIPRTGCAAPEFEAMLAFLREAQENDVIVNPRMAQEAVYHLLKGEGMALIGAILERGDRALYAHLSSLIEAAERLNIDITYERKLLEPFEKTVADDPRYWP